MAFYRRKPDIIIRNGKIVDGTGKPAYYADIAVICDKIDYIGNLKGVSAPLEIDAHHKLVTPGFIDSHQHADSVIWAAVGCENNLTQGITTAVLGNCGYSMRTGLAKDRFHPAGKDIKCVYDMVGEKDIPKGAMAAVLDKADAIGFGMNTVWLCGHNDLRVIAGINSENYTEEQFQIMADFLREAMEAGFAGLSTGLEFDPGVMSKPEEVERLAAIAAEYDANYSTHMRDEGYYILESVNEFLNVIRKTGLRGTVSHLNVKYDNGVPDDYLFKGMQMLKDAREIEHLNVYADMLSTCTAPGGVQALLPAWLYADGWDKAREILSTPKGREKVKNDFDRYWRFLAKGQWDRILKITTNYWPEVNETPFNELCEKWGKEPMECFLDIVAAAPDIKAVRSLGIRGVVFHEQIMVDSVVKDPIYLWMTDGHATNVEKPTTRNDYDFMGMTHFFTRYVRDLGAIPIEEAIAKVTGRTAQHFALKGRGVLEVGNYADINVFDINALKENSTFDDPCHYSTGIDYVIVNGVPAIANGELTKERAGKVLRHLPKK